MGAVEQETSSRAAGRWLATLACGLAALAAAPARPAPAAPDHWAFRPLRRPPLPRVKQADWCRTPVDRYILAGLEAKGLRPSPPADARTLIRRVTFDLTGLPPTPEEVEAFVRECEAEGKGRKGEREKGSGPDRERERERARERFGSSSSSSSSSSSKNPIPPPSGPSTLNPQPSTAYERLVDRLLASPRYGERWGRYWLDIVHYGDTHGYDKDKRRDNAWPYRDYVIRSLNEDRPYDRFIREQVAGDVLYPGDPDGVVATGFIAAGPWDFVGHVELREGTVEKEKTRVLDRDDMAANAMATFSSMTVHCARCHDHKFDPIPQKEYYQLQAVFAGVERGDRYHGDPAAVARREALDARRAALLARRVALQRPPQEGASAAGRAADLRQVQEELAGVDRELAALPPVQRVYAVVPRAPRPIRLLARGDVTLAGEEVSPGTLSVVPGLNADFAPASPAVLLLAPPMGPPDTGKAEEGRRRAALAAWLASPGNVLTWRSIVNRVWQGHFGRGLVDTPSDFGLNGGRPSHPGLLDYLAAEFRDGAGPHPNPSPKLGGGARGGARGGGLATEARSLKSLHRLILLSAAYRQATRATAAGARVDAENRLLWRMNRQRLEAEAIRDSVLAVSGKLDLTMGGPGFELFRFKDDHSPVYDHTASERVADPRTWRRTVYRFTPRSVPNPFLESLDCADPNLNTPVRSATLTALQALALLNDPFMVQQAGHFAARARGLAPQLPGQIDAAYRLALGRPPTAAEREALADYAREHGLANACRILFNANEFVFID